MFPITGSPKLCTHKCRVWKCKSGKEGNSYKPLGWSLQGMCHGVPSSSLMLPFLLPLLIALAAFQLSCFGFQIALRSFLTMGSHGQTPLFWPPP